MLLDNKKGFDLNLLNEKLKSKNVYMNFFLFVMGVAISAISVSVFYEPYDIITSGSTGVAILITNYINIDLSLMILVVSSILLLISFGIFGVEYGSKNILITILSPVFVKAATLINLVIHFDDVSLFLLALVAGLLSGVGFGLIKKSGYSPGGLGVLYDYINRKFKLSVGSASLICNFIIIACSSYIYGIDKCIYGIIALYVSSKVADRVMIGISMNKAFYIITKRPKEVRDYIVNNLGKTATIVNAKGGYSNKKKKMIICVLPTREYTKLKEVVKEIDKDVFFLITDSYFVSK